MRNNNSKTLVAEHNQYIDFRKPGTLGIDVKIGIKGDGKAIKMLQRQDRILKGISLFITYALLILMALVVIFPFYWMIITSLKAMNEIRADVQTFFPAIVMWSNYVDAFNGFNFVLYMGNTIFVGAVSTVGTLITTVLSAFAFARLKFAGRDALFLLFLATMMIPGEMMVISNYITVSSFGWLGGNGVSQTQSGAFLAMIIPFWVSVFYIYLLRQNMKQVPNELYLASKVDGKTDFGFLLKVMVPLVAPSLISITILKFMGTWNSYVWPNLVASKEDFFLISNGLRSASFTDLEGNTLFGPQMAATIVVTVPLFLLFVFFRKYIMRGVGRAGIKG
ncbi:MAG: carbohydrate ABC transporter permease [Bacilli bacterium]